MYQCNKNRFLHRITMSENKTIKKGSKTSQHFVPKESLKRFTNDKGMLMVYRRDLSKPFAQSPKHVACKDLLYDLDPDARYSIENYIKRIEDECQGCIDRIQDGTTVPEDEIIAARYVSMLIARSIKLKDLNDDNPPPAETLPIGYDFRNTYIAGITDSRKNLLGRPVEDYRCIIIRTEAPSFFITGDVPYAIINLRPSGFPMTMEDVMWAMTSAPDDPILESKLHYLIDQLSQAMSDVVIACPLDPTRCLMVWSKDTTAPGPRLNEASRGDPIAFINSQIAENCHEEVYSLPGNDFYPQMREVMSRINDRKHDDRPAPPHRP